MAGFDSVIHNAGQIGDATSTLDAQVIQMNDAADVMATQYRRLDESAAGQATQAGIEWGAMLNRTQQEGIQLVTQVKGAITQAHEHQTSLDTGFASKTG
ncbi:hypothetical protein [Mycobacteroides abscessus]|uniref:hypothetical protein n=1 Tax=Mycobacteroides abscessus TaxID=36809 RepID=UPI000C259FF0|nr:hypothetical protein [Mycobacteroides abscessus]